MKKQLLLGAALMTAVGAFAQTDITPANYKVGNAGVQLPFYQIPDPGENPAPLLNNINIGVPVWTTLEDGKQYNDGLVLLGSGGGMTYVQWQDFMDSWNYINFGGEIGRVACWITKDSKIQDVLGNYAPERADEWSDLHVITNQYGGGAINFFTDPNNTPTDGFIRAKVVMNIYNNNMDGNAIFNSISPVGNQNNAKSTWGDSEQTQSPMPGTQINNDACMDENSGDWDPETWVEVMIDFTVPEADEDGTSYVPYRLKFQMNGGQATAESAIFIKEVSFTHYSDGDPEYLLAPSVKYITLTQDLANAAGGEPGDVEPGPGPEVETLYLIGANVDGENWALGTNQMTYANGVYTWTGNELGSGFKINNGTWDNPEYNIGAADKSVLLEIGVPYAVVANGDSQDISFDGDPIEDPSVVFDPDAMTVTVNSGAGIHGIAIDMNAPVEYYNLQGVKVTNPVKGGMYILKQGKKSTKAIIR